MSSIESKWQIPQHGYDAAKEFAENMHQFGFNRGIGGQKSAFLAGYKAAFAHSHQPIGRLPWVRFADSKPSEHGKRYSAKILLKNDWLVNGVIELSGSVWLVASIAGQLNDFPEDRIIYWLDESTPSIQQEADRKKIRCCDNCKHLSVDNSPDQTGPSIWCSKDHFDGIASKEEANSLTDPIDCKDFVNSYPVDKVQQEAIPLQPSNEVGKVKLPEDLKEWMDNHAECDSDEDVTLWINGATAMYRKLANDNDFFDSQIADYSRMLTEELSALREEKETGDRFNGSLIDQLKRELKLAHEEKEEYRNALSEIFDGLDYETKQLIAPILDKYPSSSALPHPEHNEIELKSTVELPAGETSRILEELYEAVPQPWRDRILRCTGMGTTLQPLLEYVARFAESAVTVATGEKERRKAIDFSEWVGDRGWLLHPEIPEDEERIWYKPSNSYYIPDESMSGDQLYDLYLQSLTHKQK